MPESVQARFDPGTRKIALVLDQADAQDLADALTSTGSPRVRQALLGALQDAAMAALADQATQPDEQGEPLVVATDGGSSPNPGPSGWAWVDEHGNYGAGSMTQGTNNIAELTALEQVLLDHPAKPLRIVYDSKYAVMCATVWGPSWKSAGKTGKANQEQIFRIMDLLEERQRAGVATEFEWVKGHSGHPLNELADQVATRMRLRGDDHLESGNIPTETQATNHPQKEKPDHERHLSYHHRPPNP